MGISDFISKTASDALGRIIAQAPSQFMQLLTSGLAKTISLDSHCASYLSKHLTKVGTPVALPIASFSVQDDEQWEINGEGTCRAQADSHWQLWLVKKRPLIFKVVDTKYFVTVLRSFDIQQLMNEALQGLRRVTRPEIFGTELDAKNNSASLDFGRHLIGPNAHWASPALTVLLNEAQTWRKSRTRCQERGLPWRRGWLLHGEPGNGKTMAVKIVACLSRIHLVPLNLNMSDQQVQGVFRQAQKKAPCIVLIEDIDDIIRGRQNVKDPEHGVSFLTLLNCIDGVASADGVIVAVTTNDLTAIDPALGRPRDESHWNQLSTRPGRLDRCIRFDNPDLEGRVAIGKLLLSESEATALAHKHEDVSLVQFQAICREQAFANLQDLDALELNGVP